MAFWDKKKPETDGEKNGREYLEFVKATGIPQKELRNIELKSKYDYELMVEVQKRADFPTYFFRDIIFSFSEKNEKKAMKLIEQIQQEEMDPLPAKKPAAITEETAIELLEDLQEPKKEIKHRPGARLHQIKTRLNDKEKEIFLKRVKRSGVTQGEYIRQMILTGSVIVPEVTDEQIALQDDLAALRAEIGRIGGILKSTIKPNEGSELVSQEEWQKVFQCIRDLQDMKAHVQGLEVKNYDRKTFK